MYHVNKTPRPVWLLTAEEDHRLQETWESLTKAGSAVRVCLPSRLPAVSKELPEIPRRNRQSQLTPLLPT